jgi:hypothetical protein
MGSGVVVPEMGHTKGAAAPMAGAVKSRMKKINVARERLLKKCIPLLHHGIEVPRDLSVVPVLPLSSSYIIRGLSILGLNSSHGLAKFSLHFPKNPTIRNPLIRQGIPFYRHCVL